MVIYCTGCGERAHHVVVTHDGERYPRCKRCRHQVSQVEVLPKIPDAVAWAVAHAANRPGLSAGQLAWLVSESVPGTRALLNVERARRLGLIDVDRRDAGMRVSASEWGRTLIPWRQMTLSAAL